MAQQAATLIYLRDRSVEMLKKDLILKNPLRAWEPDTGRNTQTPRMGLVIARRGAGKTALLVQFALDSLLRGNRVVHVSVGQSLEKTKAWYEDLFQELSRNYKLEHVGEVHSEIAAGRLIMTFNAGGFSAAKLEERLADLIEQDIFHPDGIVIDGFDFENADVAQVEGLRKLVQDRKLHAWFSAVRHREEQRVSALGVPAPGDRFEGLFDCILLLDPGARGLTLTTLKSDLAGPKDHQPIRLDATTFLVSEGTLRASECLLFSGAATGAEAAFGAAAERHGVGEINFSFAGHTDARTRGLRVLTHAELERGDVSLTYVSKLMHRNYPNAPLIRKVLQTIWYQVNAGQEIYVVGWIQEDGTVRGGTGWGAEFAKLCNKPLFVFDQAQGRWFTWTGEAWEACEPPVITHPHVTGTGTRFLEENGRRAVEELFDRSFGSARQ